MKCKMVQFKTVLKYGFKKSRENQEFSDKSNLYATLKKTEKTGISH